MKSTQEQLQGSIKQLATERDAIQSFLDRTEHDMPVYVYNLLTEEIADLNVRIQKLEEVLNDKHTYMHCVRCMKKIERKPMTFICAECRDKLNYERR